MGTLFLRLQIDLLEVAIVIAASVVLTLLFDLPMQEVKNVIMESTDVSALEVSEEKKSDANENKNTESAEAAKVAVKRSNVFEDDEIAATGWEWQKDTALQGHGEGEIHAPTLKKVNGKRMPFIEHDSEEMSSKDRAKVVTRKSPRDTENYTDRKINSQRYATDDSEEEAVEYLRSQREHDEAVAQRNRRSLSRTKDNKRPSSRSSESEEEWQRRKKIEEFKRSETRGRTREADEYRSWEFVGKEGSSSKEQHESKPLLMRSADIPRKTFSSESEDESPVQGRTKPARVSSSEAKTSDEEEWERELRIRRKQFMEKLIAQQRESLVEGESEDSVEPLKRRSSAEGRIALLRDDISGEDNMNSWTVSVGPQITLLGSSQEPSEPEEDIYLRRREYREQGPPSREESLSEEETTSQDTSTRQSYTSGSQKTSLEEEDDVNSHNFILTKGSKRESLQDLSQLSQEELMSAGWNVVKKEGDLSIKPTGLFKRESIVKSQASEEDPEYLLPERPKLVQQEREHPFKKAWQMQKSRSEEEGSSAYRIIKDSKDQQSETKEKEPPIKREYSGEQSEDIELFANDESVEVTVVLRGRSTDTEDARTNSTRSGTDETDSVSTECSRATRERDHRQSSKSETDEDSAKFNWRNEKEGEEEEEATEDEVYEAGQRGKSEETDWDWEREET